MAGLQTSVYVAAGVTWAAAFVAMILRIIARRMTKQRWWFDEYFCLAAFVSLLYASASWRTESLRTGDICERLQYPHHNMYERSFEPILRILTEM